MGTMKQVSLGVCLILPLIACGDPETYESNDIDADIEEAATDLEDDLDSADPHVAPPELVSTRLRIGGLWQETDRIEARIEPGLIHVALRGGDDVEGVEVELAFDMPGAHAWLSNGFQSWSQSGVIALADSPPPSEDLEVALAARGDAEVIRDGKHLSWWYTWVATPAEDGLVAVIGALSAKRLTPSVSVWRQGDEVRAVLRSGGQGDRIAVGSEGLELETWHVELRMGKGALNAALDAFGAALPSRHRTVPHPAELGWNSWYDLWSDVDELAVRETATKLREIIAERGPIDIPVRVVIDDGWQRAWGDWYPNDKFPSGLDGLAADLKHDGLEVGVWLAPLLVHRDSELARLHPEWLVEGLTYDHFVEGPMGILDPFHPEAAAHLRDTAARLVGWGMGLLKIDFLFAGTWPGNRFGGHTGLEAYIRALELLREGAGENAILLAVGNPPTPALPLIDMWRVGPDIAVEPFGPSFPFILNALRAIAARYPFCLATLCDADPPLLRDLPTHEVDFGVAVASLTGGGIFLSDDLRKLSPERLEHLSPNFLGVGVSGEVSVPLDLVPESPPPDLRSALVDHLSGTREHVVPRQWQMPRDRLLQFNPETGKITRSPVPVQAGVSWQIQLEGALDRAPEVEVWDIDLFDTSMREIATLATSSVVICYFSAGSWEDFRPDANAFPDVARGENLEGFPDERWLDIRNADVRRALAARLDLAVSKGCDAVDPDNVNGYLADTGFDLTSEDQLEFNRWLASEARLRGLAIGLKNDLDQVTELVDVFDFAVNESCLRWDECDLLRPFIDHGKAVLHIEYQDEGQTLDSVCQAAARAGFSTLIKRSTSQVDAYRQACSP